MRRKMEGQSVKKRLIAKPLEPNRTPDVQKISGLSWAFYNTTGSSELQGLFDIWRLLVVLIAWISYLVCLGLY